jgi:hypothetical protein
MKVVPGKRYTRQQLAEAIDQSTADELKLQGYVLQYDALSQTYGVVPWYEAGGAESFGPYSSKVTQTGLRAPRGGSASFGPPPDPIKKRTPMERVDSLMLKLVDDCKRTGTIPLVDDARIKLLVGESWRAGKQLTGEDIRRVASNLLARAEKEKQLADFKKVGDYNPSN